MNLETRFLKHHRMMTAQIAREQGVKLRSEELDMIAHRVREIVEHRAREVDTMVLQAVSGKPVLSGMADGWQGD